LPGITDDLAARLPPQDLEAEQAALGSCLLEPGAAARAFEHSAWGDYYREAHKTIAKGIHALLKSKTPVDLVTVTSWLRQAGQLDECGGPEYLTALIGEVPTAAHVVRYAKIVRECALRRRLIVIGDDLAGMMYEGSNGFLDDAAQLLRDTSLDVERHAAGDQKLESLVEFMWRDRPPVEYLIEPLIPKRGFVLLFGPEKHGKTFLGMDAALSIVLARKCLGHFWVPEASNVLYLAFEGEESIYEERFARLLAGRGLDWREGCPTTLFFRRVQTDLATAEGFGMLRRFVEECVPQLVVLDPLRDAFPGVNLNASEEMAGAICTPLKHLRDDYGCSILLIHHPKKPSGEDSDTSVSWASMGSRTLPAATDVNLAIAAGGIEEGRFAVHLTTRYRPIPPFYLELQGDPGQPLKVVYGGDVDRRRRTESALALEEVLRQGPATLAELEESTGMSRRQIQGGMAALRKDKGLASQLREEGSRGTGKRWWID